MAIPFGPKKRYFTIEPPTDPPIADPPWSETSYFKQDPPVEYKTLIRGTFSAEYQKLKWNLRKLFLAIQSKFFGD